MRAYPVRFLALWLTATALAHAQVPQIAWQPDFDDAIKAADVTKKPIMIVFLMDNEVANDEVTKSHLHDPKVVELSKNFICLMACTWDHRVASPTGEAPTTRGPCPKFGCCSCYEHQRIEIRARMEFMSSPVVSAPQFLFLAPDGKTIVVQHVFLLPIDELVRKMRIALALLDPAKGGDILATMRGVTDRLIETAMGKNLDKRREAMQALAKSEDPRVIDFLIKQSADTVDEPRRLEAIAAMAQPGNGRVLPVLHKLLHSILPSIRLAVANSLNTLAMAESGPTILAAIKREPHRVVRLRLINALVTCDPTTAENRKFIITLMKSRIVYDQFFALRAIERLTLDDELKAAMLAVAAEPNQTVRGFAYWELGQKRITEATPLLTKALKSEALPAVKTLAAAALAVIEGNTYDEDAAMNALRLVHRANGLSYY